MDGLDSENWEKAIESFDEVERQHLFSVGDSAKLIINMLIIDPTILIWLFSPPTGSGAVSRTS